MNDIRLKSIGELVFSEGSTPERSPRVEHYLIPDYQRGYRWEAEVHVKALLEDIDAFIKGKADKDIYCLQPLVVTKVNGTDGIPAWEVIDGQQRLTTLYLILFYIKQNILPRQNIYSLSYTHRLESSEFIKNPEEYKDDLPDHYFISQAYKKVKSWMSKMNSQDEITFIQVLLNDVKVIWYEVTLHSTEADAREREKIDVFNRLNIGKIPLDDAELIRALFVNALSKGSERDSLLRQSMVAAEWSEMEQFLKDDGVWGFIHRKETGEYPNRILKLFETISGEKGEENAHDTYEWYEKKLKIKEEDKLTETAEMLWREVKDLYGYISHWHSDTELYHLIGLAVISGKSLKDLYRLSGENTKSAFRKKLRSICHAHFLPKGKEIEEVDYDSKAEAERLLLLFNVLTILNSSTTTLSGERFPFHLYNDNSWSLEHIHAQNPEDLSSPKVIKDWVEITLPELEHILNSKGEVADDASDEDKNALFGLIERLKGFADKFEKKEFKKDDHKEDFNKLRREIEDYFGDTEYVHNIGNLALLTREDNSSLGNSMFSVKRRKILAKEYTSFIPPCTRDVFMKAYTSGRYTTPYKWTKDDREDYVNRIKEVVKTIKEEDNDQ